MKFGFLLAVVLFLGGGFNAAASDFKQSQWRVDATRFDVSLVLESDSGILFEFYQNAGLPLAFRFSAPYLLREAESANLYLINSPLQSVKEKSLIDSWIYQSDDAFISSDMLGFDKSISGFVNHMSGGGWGRLELKDKSSVNYTMDIPSIDFNQKLSDFNRFRSDLPELNWTMAENSRVYFEIGQAGLTALELRKLDNLVEYIEIDGAIEAISIDAHTDSTGRRLNNLTLSKQRGDAVRALLMEKNVNPDLINTVRYHGERYPVAGAGGRENRRVEIRLSRQKAPVTRNDQIIE